MAPTASFRNIMSLLDLFTTVRTCCYGYLRSLACSLRTSYNQCTMQLRKLRIMMCFQIVNVEANLVTIRDLYSGHTPVLTYILFLELVMWT